MSNPIFIWTPNADQTYTGPSVTQSGFGDAFNKEIGTSFLLDAPNQTVTLQVIPKDIIEDSGTIWCAQNLSIPEADRTVIDIRNGTLVYFGGDTPTIFYLASTVDISRNIYTLIRVSSEGCFQTRATDTGGTMLSSRIAVEATSRGVIDMEYGEFIANIKEINISDQARLLIQGGFWVALHGGPINIKNNSEILLSSRLSPKPDNSDGLELGDMTLTLSENTKGYIESATFFYLHDLHFILQDNAEMVFSIGTIKARAADSNIRFSLAGAAAKIQFNSLFGYPNQPFDFINQSYPQGLFNFVTSDQINSGRFLIQTNGDHTIPSMVRTKKLIAINGIPLDPNSDQVDCHIVTDAYLQINLRN